ncbi:MAG TPA: hypothetical protein VNA13_04880 [Xanthomonadales bacterium]|nr:hypothetical protein [Xanthomonadales bacterium]
MLFIFFAILAVFTLLEGTVTTIPLVFISLLCSLIVIRKRGVFYTAFFAGLLLDLLTVRAIGSTFLFLLLFFYVMLLYRKKYEIVSFPFIIVSTFIGGYLYLLIFAGVGSMALSAICSIIAVVLFILLSLVNGAQKQSYLQENNI